LCASRGQVYRPSGASERPGVSRMKRVEIRLNTSEPKPTRVPAIMSRMSGRLLPLATVAQRVVLSARVPIDRYVRVGFLPKGEESFV